MLPNHSPWIKQLKRTRPVVPLTSNSSTDIVIVGGGIAGVSTAFFTLQNTHYDVVLLEADKVAHGATGHNAGQITSYFERPFSELVKEFGLELAAAGQRDIESAWSLVDEIRLTTKMQMPLYKFVGYAGLTSLEQVLGHLQENRLRLDGGLSLETLVVAEEWAERANIPSEYQALYTILPHQEVLELLETNSKSYIASLAYPKGCMNSALFTEELIGYLIATYPQRFTLYEGSPVTTVRVGATAATLEVLEQVLTASKVVLCTNGFENFHIVNEVGDEIDTTFHHLVNGRIGYMAGYIEPPKHPPVAISYFPKSSEIVNDPTGDSYFYLTRRPHEHESNTLHNLVCTGGPERVLPNNALYSRHDEAPEDMRELIDCFLKDTYCHYPEERIEYAFSWHGLMGYTPNGVRRIGPEPCNPILLYNLGCNGVGILPSVYGGKRISQFLQGLTLDPSIFDPRAERC